jgi:hypothetical protein
MMNALSLLVALAAIRVFLVAVRNVRFRAPYARTPAPDAMDGAPYRRTRDEG